MHYKRIVFPKDESKHNNIVEWWYFNGNLKDSKGKKYSYMDCLFKVDNKRAKIPALGMLPLRKWYFSHELLSDLSKKKFHSQILPYLSVVDFGNTGLNVNYKSPFSKKSYSMSEYGKFCYRIKSEYCDLIMTSKKKPILEGGKGFLEYDGKQTYYYSLTNLSTKGFIIVDGKKIKVSGKSWMDHQWADATYSKDGWTWFSVQLHNDLEIVCYNYGKGHMLASMIDKHGKTFHTENVEIVPNGKHWKSNITGANYPVSWIVRIPSKKLELKIDAIEKDQEMVFGYINYWEGPVSVSATIDGRKVEGEGFMELVGYPVKNSVIKQHEIMAINLLKGLKKKIV